MKSIASVLALSLLAACATREKEEAARLVSAVADVRHAPDARKAEGAALLEALPCSAPAVCEARQECAAYARRTAEGHVITSEVKLALEAVRLGKLDPESPEARALFGKLDEGERALAEGEAALLRCDERIQRLKRELRL